MEKKECWLSWSEFLESKSQANIILAGDLNINLAPNEKKGGNRGKDYLQDIVEELIQVWELIDLKNLRLVVSGGLIKGLGTLAFLPDLTGF